MSRSSQILIVFQCMLRPAVVKRLPVLPIALNLSNTDMNPGPNFRVPEEVTHEISYPQVPPDILASLEEIMLREALRTLGKSNYTTVCLTNLFRSVKSLENALPGDVKLHCFLTCPSISQDGSCERFEFFSVISELFRTELQLSHSESVIAALRVAKNVSLLLSLVQIQMLQIRIHFNYPVGFLSIYIEIRIFKLQIDLSTLFSSNP